MIRSNDTYKFAVKTNQYKEIFSKTIFLIKKTNHEFLLME